MFVLLTTHSQMIVIDIALAIFSTAFAVTAFCGDTLDKNKPGRIWQRVTVMGYLSLTLLAVGLFFGVYKVIVTGRIEAEADKAQNELKEKTAAIQALVQTLPNSTEDQLKNNLKNLANGEAGRTALLQMELNIVRSEVQSKTDELRKELAAEINTKTDDVKNEIKNKTDDVKAGLTAEIKNKTDEVKSGLTAEIKNKTDDVKSGLTAEIKNRTDEVKSGLTAEIKNKTEEVRSGLAAEIKTKTDEVRSGLMTEIRNLHVDSKPVADSGKKREDEAPASKLAAGASSSPPNSQNSRQ